MKFIFTSLFFILIALSGFAQNQPVVRCYTNESMQDFRRKNPGAETDAQFESWLSQKISERAVVFHIVHNGES